MSPYYKTPWLVRTARATLHCDRRILYVIFAVFLVILNMKLLRVDVPVPPEPGTQDFFDLVEDLPSDKIVLLSNDWGAGNKAECAGQFEAILRHCFARNTKVALVNWVHAIDAIALTKESTERIAKSMNKEYGKDYIIFSPIVVTGGPTIAGMSRDIAKIVKTDYINSKPIGSYPIMDGIKNIDDVSLICHFAYMWESVNWIGFVQGVYGTPFCCGAAAITASTAYPMYTAGQMSGLMNGASGAAQYEELLLEKYGREKLGLDEGEEGEGTATVRTQSFASAFVVLAIIIGNIALFIERVYHMKQQELA